VTAPSVAVVVLSWNKRATTLACLGSLLESSYESLAPICVDNGSVDGSPDAIAEAFPAVTLVRLERNTGFAAGMNTGIRAALAAGADHVLTLNDDMTVDSGFVEPLVRALEADGTAGAACCQILFAAPPDRVWYAGAQWRARRGYHGRHVRYGEPPLAAETPPYVTDRACAGAMLVPRDVWESVGLFDEALFAYAEDVDWSLRLRSKGLHVLVVPASVVRHEVSESSGGESSPATIYYGLRNGLAVSERWAPLGAVRTVARRAEALAAHALQAALFSRRRLQALRAVWRGWRDFRMGRLGPMR
jgi:GT2 family glycosyltransferase